MVSLLFKLLELFEEYAWENKIYFKSWRQRWGFGRLLSQQQRKGRCLIPMCSEIFLLYSWVMKERHLSYSHSCCVNRSWSSCFISVKKGNKRLEKNQQKVVFVWYQKAQIHVLINSFKLFLLPFLRMFSELFFDLLYGNYVVLDIWLIFVFMWRELCRLCF